MTELALDYEGRSEVPLGGMSSHGLDKYANDPSTEATMLAYAWNRGPVLHVDFTDGGTVPPDVKDALLDPHVIKRAFNAQFERVITEKCLGIATPVKGWRCTMAEAYSQSFVGGLAEIGEQLGLDGSKLKDPVGKRLIEMFAKPQRITRNQPHLWRDRHTDPAEWEQFCGYNRQDVVTEIAVLAELEKRRMLPAEWELYEIDQAINDRGLPVDRLFVQNAIQLVRRRRAELMQLMREATGLDNPNSGPQFLPWAKERGYRFDDLQKDTVKKVLAEHKEGLHLIEQECVAGLKLRQQVNRISVKKYDAILLRLADDDRLRYCFQFNGASRTGRWAGRGPQPHNLSRTPKKFEGDGDDFSKAESVIEAIRDNDYDTLELIGGEPMDTLAGVVRSSFTAPDGYEFVVCDLSAIETAIIGWLADCKRLLKVFADGRDPYKDFAMGLYGVSYDAVTKKQRGESKPAVLGCFEADTLVLTDTGWKPIVNVQPTDFVFDGVDFVRHQGLAYQGVKETIDLAGVGVTPEHLILTKHGWKEACQLSRSSRLVRTATALASGMFWRSSTARKARRPRTCVDAPVAARKSRFPGTALKPDKVRAVCLAGLKNGLYGMARFITGLTPREMLWTGLPIGTTPSSQGVRTARTLGMPVGASKTVLRRFTSSLLTACPCLDTIKPTLTLIARTMTGTTKPVTSTLSREPSTTGTKRVTGSYGTRTGIGAEKIFTNSLRLSTRTLLRCIARYAKDVVPRRSSPDSSLFAARRNAHVYDLLNCGPRSRFMVLTDAGPMIAHNCGFVLGGGRLIEGKRTGLWGYAEGMGVNITQAAALRQVKYYRNSYPEIPALWEQLNRAVKLAMDGKPNRVNGLLTFEKHGGFLQLGLPSGRKIYYHKPRMEERTYDGESGTFTRTVLTAMGTPKNKKTWQRVVIGTSLLIENPVQAIGRDCLAHGIRQAHAYGFNIVGSVHDEIICLQRKGDNRYTLDALRECMISGLTWANGLPLNAAGYVGKTYRKD